MKIDYQVERDSLSEQIAERIQAMILNDKTQVNDRLPSETALAAGFNVSRPIIREALTILKARGLVVQRQGGGSFVTCPDLKSVNEYIYRAIVMNHISYEDTFQARMTLEVAAAHRAAEIATDEDIAELRKITKQMAEAENNEVRARCDLRFHQTISDISGNKILNAFQQSLNMFLEPILIANLQLPGAAEDGEEFHERIIRAIEKHDVREVEEIMRQHLMLSMRNYELVQNQT